MHSALVMLYIVVIDHHSYYDGRLMILELGRHLSP